MKMKMMVAGLVLASLPSLSFSQSSNSRSSSGTGFNSTSRTGSSSSASTRQSSRAASGTATSQSPFTSLQIGTDTSKMQTTNPFATQSLSPTTSQGGTTSTGSTNRNSLNSASRLSGNRGGSFGNSNGLNNLNIQNDDPSDFRSSIPRIIRIGFEKPPIPAVNLSKDYVAAIPRALPGSRNLGFSIVNGTATISGKVASQHDKDLAAAVLALEPGINAIVNNLEVVGKTAPTATDKPAAK